MMTKNIKNTLHKNAAWVSYISPFKLIVPDNEKPLAVTLDQINSNTYDHGQLCRIVGMLPVLSKSDYKLVVCYDGALAIPRIENFKNQENAVELFNNLLCQLLLGGVFCEAVDKRDIVWGQLYEKRLLWPVDLGESASSHLHSKVRMRLAGNIDSIILGNPSYIRYSDFVKSLNTGKSVLEKIYNLTPTYLIRGATEIKYKNWGLALSSLWITIEQLTEYLWKEIFIKNKTLHPENPIPNRIKSLQEDHRTWSISVKQEILFQANIINHNIFQKLYPIRQARNGLVHNGDNIERSVAISAYDAVTELIMLCSEKTQLPMKDVGLEHERMDQKQSQDFEFDDWVELSKNAA
jgi:hypothetical protein